MYVFCLSVLSLADTKCVYGMDMGGLVESTRSILHGRWDCLPCGGGGGLEKDDLLAFEPRAQARCHNTTRWTKSARNGQANTYGFKS
jgi:hypothetical protein